MTQPAPGKPPYNLLIMDYQRNFRRFCSVTVYSQSGPMTHWVTFPDCTVDDRAEIVALFASQIGVCLDPDFESNTTLAGNDVTYEYRILQEF